MKKEYVKFVVIGLSILAVAATTYYIYNKKKKKKVVATTQAATNFDAKSFLQGKWNLKYSTATDPGGSEDATILDAKYLVDGTNTAYDITNVAFEPATKTLSFTKKDSQGNLFPMDSLVVDTVGKTMKGTEGGWNVVYTKK